RTVMSEASALPGGEVRALPSVRPQANLLQAFRRQALAICHISDIPDDEGADLPLLRLGAHRAADFVLQVSCAAPLPGKASVSCPAAGVSRAESPQKPGSLRGAGTSRSEGWTPAA